ncbi:MAG: hypothetical protein ACK58T_26325, partial [Phycisphaerae bacterium]
MKIRDSEKIELVREAFRAHAYWRMKGLSVDLVIWNEDDTVYRQSLQDSIMDAFAASPASALMDRPGGIFIRRGEQISEEDRSLLQTVARVVLKDDAGTLGEQADRRARVEPFPPPLRRSIPVHRIIAAADPAPRDLEYFNGVGGFSRDGREYVTLLKPGTA